MNNIKTYHKSGVYIKVSKFLSDGKSTETGNLCSDGVTKKRSEKRDGDVPPNAAAYTTFLPI